MSVQEVPLAYRRAGGRRRVNLTRQLHARLRRAEVARLLADTAWVRGSQKAIAEHLGVSEATISRDVAAIMRTHVRCPSCFTTYTADAWHERTGQDPPYRPGVHWGREAPGRSSARSPTVESPLVALEDGVLDEPWVYDDGDAWDSGGLDDSPPPEGVAKAATVELSVEAFRLA